ncbi:MAG: DUF3787 domain-containing protein [Clostridia bacterium]|nr:DUF3787 domain-containing protein [Clostridia bacterium]
MAKKRLKKEKAALGEHKTLALSEESRRDEQTNAAIPSEDAASRARDWCQENKL